MVNSPSFCTYHTAEIDCSRTPERLSKFNILLCFKKKKKLEID